MLLDNIHLVLMFIQDNGCYESMSAKYVHREVYDNLQLVIAEVII